MLNFFFRRRQSDRRRPLRRFFTPRGESLERRHLLSTETWSGGDNNDSNWTSNGNWDGIGGAGPDDDLVFPESASRKTTSNNDFDANTSFNSLKFTGNGYVISGNEISLSAGITNDPGAGTAPVFNPNIVLGADQTFNSLSNHVELNGVININGHNLKLTGAGDHRLDNTLTGTGNISKSGSGTAILSGNNPNITGNIDGGTLRVESGAALGSLTLHSGTLSGSGTVKAIFGNNPGFPNDGIISPGQNPGNSGTLTANSSVLFAPTSTYAVDINGASQFDHLNVTGNAVLNGAILDVTLGFSPTVGQTFTILQTSGTGNNVSGQFAQGANALADGQIFRITYNSTSVVLTALGSTLTWDGGGADNNWSTAANWNPDVAPADGLDLIFPAGAPANSLSNANDISGLDLQSLTFTGPNYDISGNALTLSNGIAASVHGGVGPDINLSITLTHAQTFSNNGSAGAFDGQISLNGFGLTVDGTGNYNFFGPVIGGGGITKNGTGTLFLSDNGNNYTGVTQVNSGKVSVRATNGLGAMGTGNSTVVATGATLEMDFNVLSVPEAITINGTGAGGTGALRTGNCSSGCSISGAITLASNSTVSVDPGSNLTLSGAIGGTSLGLNKVGTGTLVLTATNGYDTTTINAGTVLVNGSSNGMNLIGGTLGGNGIVSGITATGGTVSPGAGPGALDVHGFVTFNSATTFNVELGGITPGTNHDQLLITNSISLGGANLTGSLINGFTPKPGDQFTIISNTTGGPINGKFAQSDNNIIIGGHQFSITYNASSVVLTALARTCTWDGGGADNNWTTAANWVGDVAPAVFDNLVFPAGVPANSLSNTNNFPAGTTFGSLAFSGGGYDILGNDFALSDGITLTATSGGSVTIDRDVTLTHAQTVQNTGSVALNLFDINLNGFGVTIDGTNLLNLLGTVTGAGGIIKNGTGSIIIASNNNNYAGPTQINNGTIIVNATNGLGATGTGNSTVVASGASLVVNASIKNVPEDIVLNGTGVEGQGALQTSICDAGCSISGAITLASDSTLKVADSTLTLSGAIGGGANGLTKIGLGTLVLGATNTYTGTTTVHSGTLLVNGSLAAGADAVVQFGGVLGGTGTINGPVTINNGGHLAPGGSPGILNTGNLTLNAGSTLDIEITNANSNGFDKVVVTGTVTINTTGAGVTLHPTTVGNLNLQDSQQLSIIVNNNSGTLDPVQGTFQGLDEGANLGSNFLGSGKTATISYKGFTGNDNDVVLTMSPGSPFPWHNFTANQESDVRGGANNQPDGHIVADDVIGVINYINAKGSGPIPADAVIGLPFGFLDPTQDNNVAADDVLKIINFINAHPGLNEAAAPTMDSANNNEHFLSIQVNPSGDPLPLELLVLLATDLATQPLARRRN